MHVTPVASELLAASLAPFGRSSTLPAEAYTDEAVFRWELEHFFDESWVCVGRADGHVQPGDQRVVEWHGWLFANLLISLHPDYVLTHRLNPLAPDRTRVECEWLFSREATQKAEGFDPSYASDFWDVTNHQDWHACESVQRGASSRGYRRGPLSPREDAVYQLITMVANGYLEGKVSRPASRVAETAG
jgi:phenylpropionate dioxygenase-like ring-hydroxylating dioxygenase large terminal subunit